MATVAAFADFLEKYRDELKTALDNESEKRRALIGGDPKRLEAMLQLQQAETMKLQNLEQKRLAMQKELGYEGLTASAFAEAVKSDSEGPRIARTLAEIVSLVNDLKDQNTQAIELANGSLKIMEQAVASAGIDQQHGLYSPETARGGTYSKDPSFEKMV